jgi:type VI secretion system secreted protein VgrG
MAGVAQFQLIGPALPSDAYALSFAAREAISSPFWVKLRFETIEQSLNIRSLLRTRVALVLADSAGANRYFDGAVETARFAGLVGNHLVFELELRPTLYALAHRADHRIFQEQSIPEVVKTIFGETGIDSVEWDLKRTHKTRELIVQYGETTLNFVSRLLEEAGIFYYFEHNAEGCTLRLYDTIEGFEQTGPLLALSPQEGEQAELIEQFTRRRALKTTSVHLRDYNFHNPRTLPEGGAAKADNWPSPYFEYPARSLDPAELEDLAKVRLAELRAGSGVCQGESGAVGVKVGHAITVVGSHQNELDGCFIVTALLSQGEQNNGSSKVNVLCTNWFDGIPYGAPFAPARRTPKPLIRGHQTAFVTGDDNADQAICTDAYGRVKIRFHWDRVSQRDANSSPWVRVAQLPLGGAMVLPRVGWEVTVAFLEGDPDRPLVLGRTYNSEAAPPMSLPAGKASGCLESMSSPGGAGSNKISMGDSGGSQGNEISAQKDLNITTGNDCAIKIGVDDSHEINANYSRTVAVDDTLTVTGSQNISIGANLSTKIGGNQTITVGAADTSNATGNVLENIGGNRAYTIGGAWITVCNGVQREITGDLSRTTGAAQVILSADSISDNVLTGTISTVGAVRIHVTGGSHGEVVGGAKSETEAAAAIHLVQGAYTTEAGANLAYTVGGIHLRKIVADYSVTAPTISLMGALGVLIAGSSRIALSGGPMTLKASKISIKAPMIRRVGGTIKFL